MQRLNMGIVSPGERSFVLIANNVIGCSASVAQPQNAFMWVRDWTNCNRGPELSIGHGQEPVLSIVTVVCCTTFPDTTATFPLNYKAHHPLGNIVAATLEISKEIFMNLIMTMIFMKIPLKFQVLLQQSCLVDGGLKLNPPLVLEEIWNDHTFQ